jgi:hypothetical protein
MNLKGGPKSSRATSRSKHAKSEKEDFEDSSMELLQGRSQFRTVNTRVPL